MAKPIFMAAATLAVTALHLTALPRLAAAATVKWSEMDVISPLTDDDGESATNISGVNCIASAGKLVCLVIDDEGRLAQAATIDGSKLKGGGKIRLLEKDAPTNIVGKEPTVVACSKKKDKFKDLDGEAVAHGGKFFYVAGSHGCSRNSNKFRASSFILARIPDDAVAKASDADPNAPEDKVSATTSYRLSEALLAASTVKASFAKDLMTDNGMNIEGLVVLDGTLYAGLRAPILATKSYMIAIDVAALFDAARTIEAKDVREVDLDLGGRGIRDLAVLADGRLLVLSGPAQAQTLSFALHVVDPKSGSASQLAELDGIPADWKAEALQILRQGPDELDLLIMFDGAKSGGPRKYSIDLK
ncbi:hypothetical protein ACVIGB_008920 [Bradyrhizobium sp. USDA 4341]